MTPVRIAASHAPAVCELTEIAPFLDAALCGSEHWQLTKALLPSASICARSRFHSSSLSAPVQMWLPSQHVMWSAIAHNSLTTTYYRQERISEYRPFPSKSR